MQIIAAKNMINLKCAKDICNAKNKWSSSCPDWDFSSLEVNNLDLKNILNNIFYFSSLSSHWHRTYFCHI